MRAVVNWTPIDPLTIQFFVDWRDDATAAATDRASGPRKGEARNYSVDAAYMFSDKWQANAWYTLQRHAAEQSTCEARELGRRMPRHRGRSDLARSSAT